MDLLLETAQNFKRASGYNYHLLTERNEIVFELDLCCLKSEFTHITGLDHLDSLNEFGKGSIKRKESLFQDIIKGKLTYDYISQEPRFHDKFPMTFNPRTQREYTLAERIEALRNIEAVLDSVHMGRLYEWSIQRSKIPVQGGRTRRCNINAKYMLAIPTETAGEHLYLFLFEEQRKKGKIPKLCVFSAFPDGYNVAKGQKPPYTIVKVIKTDVRNETSSVLFPHDEPKE